MENIYTDCRVQRVKGRGKHTFSRFTFETHFPLTAIGIASFILTQVTDRSQCDQIGCSVGNIILHPNFKIRCLLA